MNEPSPRPRRLLELPDELAAERFEVLLERGGGRVERIVSPPGHATEPGFWYDQDADEGVAVLAGRGAIELEGRRELLWLEPGDWLVLPAHCRHRVAATDPDRPTVWLAVHLA